MKRRSFLAGLAAVVAGAGVAKRAISAPKSDYPWPGAGASPPDDHEEHLAAHVEFLRHTSTLEMTAGAKIYPGDFLSEHQGRAYPFNTRPTCPVIGISTSFAAKGEPVFFVAEPVTILPIQGAYEHENWVPKGLRRP